MAVNGHTYLADLAHFVDTMFPIPEEDITAVYDLICKQGFYNEKTAGWRDRPEEGAKEEKYEDMFINAAEAIRKANLSINGDTNFKLITEWRRFPNKVPKSLQNYSSLIRPDVVLALLTREQEDETLLLRIQKLQEDLREGGLEDPENKEKQAQLDEMLKAVAVWWSRVNVVVEVKRKKERNTTPIVQLLSYMERVLQEQLDRRSTFGLLLLKNDLSVWYLDRSGVVGTQKAFDIHKDPKTLIQIVLASSFGTPESMGWDTSMRVWRGHTESSRALHSFDPNLEFKFYAARHKRWVIEMPSHDDCLTASSSTSATRVAYLTIEPISIARAEVMFGRATLVWAVMKLEDVGTSNHDIFVLKQAWRPATSLMESKLIPKGARHVAQVVSSEELTSGGFRVETMSYLRHGMKYTSQKGMRPRSAQQTDKTRKRSQQQVDNEEKAQPRMSVLALTDLEININSSSEDVISRVQTRTLLNDYGWPLQMFRNLEELLRVVEGCVRAQKEMYHIHSTLQRDVSFGNILIRPGPEGDITNTECCIIDFDYGKKTDKRSPSLLGIARNLPEMKEDHRQAAEKQREELSQDIGRPIPPALDRIIWLYRVSIPAYFDDLRRLIPPSDQESAVLQLGFLSESDTVPEFREIKGHQKERTGTAPFASPEILRNLSIMSPHARSAKPVYLSSGNPPKIIKDEWRDYVISGEERNGWGQGQNQSIVSICHNAVHESESHFWVVTYICLTREGPGGNRRVELLPATKRTPASTAIIDIHLRLFAEEDDGALALFKQQLFTDGSYSKAVSPYFHPYFSPLKEMMDEWFKVLVMAHRWPAFEAIHDYVLAPIEQAIQKVKKQPEDPAYAPLTCRVDQFRLKGLDYLYNFASETHGTEPSASFPVIDDGSSVRESDHQATFSASRNKLQ